jgi:hypothetical protein
MTRPSRRYSDARRGPGGGSFWGSICTAIEIRLSTRTVPLRSMTSPRGAGTTMSRTRLSLAWVRYLSPESTCRYQSRKKTIANIARAIPAITATRSASWGVIGALR